MRAKVYTPHGERNDKGTFDPPVIAYDDDDYSEYLARKFMGMHSVRIGPKWVTALSLRERGFKVVIS